MPFSMMIVIGIALVFISGFSLWLLYQNPMKNGQNLEEGDREKPLQKTIQSLDETEEYIMRRIDRLSRKEIDRTNDKQR